MMAALVFAHRRLALAFALAATLATLLLSTAGGRPAAAATKSGHDFVYYNDAAHDSVVGYRYYCIGNSGGYGSISPYFVENVFDC
jgi:hypothetical protein